MNCKAVCVRRKIFIRRMGWNLIIPVFEKNNSDNSKKYVVAMMEQTTEK